MKKKASNKPVQTFVGLMLAPFTYGRIKKEADQVALEPEEPQK